jgi:hypothetical protein
MDQMYNASEAIREAMNKLRYARPHPRDYYTQEEGAFEKARDQHAEWEEALQQVSDALLAMWTHLDEDEVGG